MVGSSRAHRVLEHRPHLPAPHGAHAPRRGAGRSSPMRRIAPTDDRFRLRDEQSLHGKADGGFSRAAFADDGDDSRPARDVEVDAVEDPRPSAVAVERDTGPLEGRGPAQA